MGRFDRWQNTESVPSLDAFFILESLAPVVTRMTLADEPDERKELFESF